MKAETKEMAKSKEQDLQKQEVKDEKTVAGRFYQPLTDIVESNNALIVTMDMPGVAKENVNVKVEKNVLEVEGQIDSSPYLDTKPIYTEYNVGHYTRRFTVSSEIDTEKIEASLDDGVLHLTLPKKPEAEPRRISVS
ncbi:MAG: Hsp20/alpha crystallin family protein [SAR324 cluster bacterium]|nr:Hsp20/alpha crystallin family protein [SAR324 cluster bacterium]